MHVAEIEAELETEDLQRLGLLCVPVLQALS